MLIDDYTMAGVPCAPREGDHGPEPGNVNEGHRCEVQAEEPRCPEGQVLPVGVESLTGGEVDLADE